LSPVFWESLWPPQLPRSGPPRPIAFVTGAVDALMNIVTGWLRQPQRVWLRRAIFQIHLWTGLAIGLYVVVLSLSGSVLVYRAEISQFVASPRATLNQKATPDDR
jgi:hypothetical protein